ncbi:hypothetical protein LAZ67_4004348 [Cordylochernes scorpioides]|uniref:Uncharacterized protein n=1 Tax=Cordylochernes scorpioides TaxID=51811 RepID=A0ABY6KEE1_9ARAC|nr:hypothetical protein LAZ67_4004348 [Cordylochernes scorpioides]
MSYPPFMALTGIVILPMKTEDRKLSQHLHGNVYELLGQPCSRVRTRHLEVGFGHGRAHGGEHGAHVVALVLPLDVRYGERAVSGHGEPAVRPLGEHEHLGALPRPEHSGRLRHNEDTNLASTNIWLRVVDFTKIFNQTNRSLSRHTFTEELSKFLGQISNNQVLDRMGTERQLIKFIKQRKLTFVGHVMRGSAGETLLTVLEGKLQGNRSRGRRRQGYTDDLKQWTG